MAGLSKSALTIWPSEEVIGTHLSLCWLIVVYSRGFDSYISFLQLCVRALYWPRVLILRFSY